jgi:hypothetical protein
VISLAQALAVASGQRIFGMATSGLWRCERPNDALAASLKMRSYQAARTTGSTPIIRVVTSGC